MKSFLTSLIRKYSAEVDYLEIRIEESEDTQIIIKGKSIDSMRQSSEKGGCVRAIFKGGWGFSTFNSLDIDNLDYFIRSAVKQALLVGKDVSQLAPVPVIDAVIPICPIVDPRAVPLQKKVELLKTYNDMIMGSNPLIRMSSVSYSDTYQHVWLATSEGTYIDREHLDLGGGITPIAVKDGQTQMSSVGFGSSNNYNVLLNLDDKVKDACKIAVNLLDAPPVPGGTYTVVADPHLAGVFVHEAFGHTSEGEKVFENEKLAEIMKFGEVFGSPILTIYDSGLDTGSRGALEYDDEGVKTEKTVLIQNGILSGRLHSRETAGKMNEKATGNGRALNYMHPPIPRMRCTCIAQGETPVEDLIKEIKLGVFAVDALGGQGGEMFSFTAGRGYMIRDGKVEEMVKNVTVSGNLFETLKKIDAIGNDFRVHESGGGCGKGSQFPLPVSSGSPSIRLRDVVIAGN
jgi:TldD protein